MKEIFLGIDRNELFMIRIFDEIEVKQTEFETMNEIKYYIKLDVDVDNQAEFVKYIAINIKNENYLCDCNFEQEMTDEDKITKVKEIGKLVIEKLRYFNYKLKNKNYNGRLYFR